MTKHRITGLLIAAALAWAPALATERNGWPLTVVTHDDVTGEIQTRRALGPIWEWRRQADGATSEVVRPLALRDVGPGDRETFYLLYPFFTWSHDGEERSFSFFKLVNTHERRSAQKGDDRRAFDVWPFYFSRDTGDAATSYRAFFPFYGTIKNRFGRDRITWTAFPFYAHTEKAGRHITHAPWPFVRVTRGAGHRGFEIWPLGGHIERPGYYRRDYALWPLLYRSERAGDAGTMTQLGVLPFYTRDTGPGWRNENWLWPFFGVTDRTQPVRYHETRWLWPLLVQGRGDNKYVNRWAPLWTHSVVNGRDKTWVLWPLWRQERWQADGLEQEKKQFLYIFAWSLEQRDPARPQAAPATRKHFWPFLSSWDNGAGRRQWQFLSPLDIFFPRNEPIRKLYTPLFALYRSEQSAPGHTRWSLLWGAASGQHEPAKSEFNLGPLWRQTSTADRQRIAIAGGLLSLTRKPAADHRWRLAFLDFNQPPAPAASQP